MSDDLRSILLGTSGLTVAAVVAGYLTIRRRPRSGPSDANRAAARLFAFGIVAQGAHFGEEWATHFHERFPQLLNLTAWSDRFFIGFNLLWILIWIASAFGVRRRMRLAYFPAWFLAIGLAVNGVAHPALAVASGGYFPGLATSPIVGVLGILLWRQLRRATEPAGA